MLQGLWGGLAALNLCAVRILVRNTGDARTYLSQCLRRYEELSGRGLPHRDVVAYVRERRGAAVGECAVLPTQLHGGGGVSPAELAVLAAVTAVLRPRKVFEIGTFAGLTTSTFALNAPAGGAVYTLDLPPDVDGSGGALRGYLASDVRLVQVRQLGYFIDAFGVRDRCHQILCDSTRFDPAPHRSSVDLGFIDGAHTDEHVRNDTEKMASMMAGAGVVLWHDYGGRGTFRDVTRYLEALGRCLAVHRIAGTTLAWADADDLRAHFRA